MRLLPAVVAVSFAAVTMSSAQSSKQVYPGANPALPFKNVKELVAYAKARPGKLNYGTVGLGSTNHFTEKPDS